MLKIRRALISVWDKKGIVPFAKKISALNVEIISTGKTAVLLKRNGVNVMEVASVTEFPEILSGRVKTLHPKIFGGILANKKHPLHLEEIRGLGIQPIDMVVVNLYPFIEKISEGLSSDEMIEYIDVGGPSMLRAAGKNYKNVACVSSIQKYKIIISELEKNKGFMSDETLKLLAQEVFYLTKEYDNAIYNYLIGRDVITWNLEKKFSLRYGENPHQKGGLFCKVTNKGLNFKQLQGKELSYNNFFDLDTAFLMIKEFDEPASVIVKHSSICGVGVGNKLAFAYKKAYMADMLSSFGGIVSLNKKVDKDTASQILKSGFKECIIAPAYSKEALKIFSTKKNLRVLSADFNQVINPEEIKSTVFSYLTQDRDIFSVNPKNLKVVTKRNPTQRELKDLVFAWKVVKFVKSNAIVIAKNSTVLGISGGQSSRVGAVNIALKNSISTINAAVLASDGFFPKEDSIAAAAKKGIKAIIQPGGSIKDDDVIALCDKLGISMVFTGIRHFRH